jgi:hypothetical protein
MNNTELDRLLKTVRVPDRSEDYWAQFPNRVNTALHWRSQRRASEAAGKARHRLSFKLAAWGTSLAVACAVLGFAIGFWKGRDSSITEAQLALAQKYYHELAALFPNQLEAVVFDERGPRIVLSETPAPPSSAPVYLRACGPQGCRRFITFSGRQIQINGTMLEVLVDAQGHVLLVGEHMAWTSADAAARIDGYRFAAKTLSST